MCEAEVRRVGMHWGRVYARVVQVPGVSGGGVRGCGVSVPVICDFVVVEDVEPGDRRDGWPVGGGVYLAVFAAVGFDRGAEAEGYVDVDEIAEEKHEGGVEGWKPFRKMLEAGDRKRVCEGVIGEVGFYAAGGEECEFGGVWRCSAYGSSRGEETSVIV